MAARYPGRNRATVTHYTDVYKRRDQSAPSNVNPAAYKANGGMHLSARQNHERKNEYARHAAAGEEHEDVPYTRHKDSRKGKRQRKPTAHGLRAAAAELGLGEEEMSRPLRTGQGLNLGSGAGEKRQREVVGSLADVTGAAVASVSESPSVQRKLKRSLGKMLLCETEEPEDSGRIDGEKVVDALLDTVERSSKSSSDTIKHTARAALGALGRGGRPGGGGDGLT